MIETLESKVRKLEGKGGPIAEEPPKFRVFGIACVDGGYARTNLRTGNTKPVDPASIGITPYVARDISQTNAEREDASQDVVAVPAAVVSPQESAEAEQARRIEETRKAIERDFGEHPGETMIWSWTPGGGTVRW